MAEAVEIAFREVGSGAPVVVLHGLLGNGRNWAGVAQKLSGSYRVLLPDQRNHGASPWADDASYPALAADLFALLDRAGLASATIIGHSMGGKAALVAALEAPERVDRLILVDIAPVALDAGLGVFVEAMAAMPLEGITKRSDADARLAGDVPDPVVRGFLLQNLEQEGEGWAWRVNLAALRRALAEISGFPADREGRIYDGPAAVIRGSRSPYVAPEHEPGLRRYLPDVPIETVEDAGHWPHAEQPARFLDALHRCLAS